MMHTELEYWLNNVCKIFCLDHIRHGHGDCKIEYSKHLKRFLACSGNIATCGYKGNRRMKVDAVSQTLYTRSKITSQEDNNISE